MAEFTSGKKLYLPMRGPVGQVEAHVLLSIQSIPEKRSKPSEDGVAQEAASKSSLSS